MGMRRSIFALGFVVACGCATERVSKTHGDVGLFIVQQVIRCGGSPTTTNGLPVIASQWDYLEDSNGMQIHLRADAYSDVEMFLNRAFANQRQFGPKVSEDGRTRIHEYRMSEKGGGVQLTEQDSETHVLILRPFGVSK
jgi:hypothetical protein